MRPRGVAASMLMRVPKPGGGSAKPSAVQAKQPVVSTVVYIHGAVTRSAWTPCPSTTRPGVAPKGNAQAAPDASTSAATSLRSASLLQRASYPEA